MPLSHLVVDIHHLKKMYFSLDVDILFKNNLFIPTNLIQNSCFRIMAFEILMF
jgi:hypothetical protein